MEGTRNFIIVRKKKRHGETEVEVKCQLMPSAEPEEACAVEEAATPPGL